MNVCIRISFIWNKMDIWVGCWSLNCEYLVLQNEDNVHPDDNNSTTLWVSFILVCHAFLLFHTRANEIICFLYIYFMHLYIFFPAFDPDVWNKCLHFRCNELYSLTVNWHFCWFELLMIWWDPEMFWFSKQCVHTRPGADLFSVNKIKWWMSFRRRIRQREYDLF